MDLNPTNMMAMGPCGGDVNTGGVSRHPGLVNDNADWLRIVGTPPGHGVKDGLVCSISVAIGGSKNGSMYLMLVFRVFVHASIMWKAWWCS